MNKEDIYKTIIVSNNSKPHKKLKDNNEPIGYIEEETKKTSCTDNFKVFVKMNDNEVEDVVFKGNGCAISTSSLNIISNYISGMKNKEAKELLTNYKKMIVGEKYNADQLKDLIAYENIHNFLNRVECASTGANAIITAMEKHEKN